MYSLLESLSKTLKERLFGRIGEFHSGPKRATGGAGGMRDAGAGGAGSPAVNSPANVAAGALFEV
ncbi:MULTISPECIES: hypothetical protein [unclassified Bradyrhizobium]|uniref:hypothetical protein n=1 Tax=unclassified Bradyrhizobium TaxID=2631580 RepID=UPI0024797003|nr:MULTISPECIES: hypothetical protein [unclassified Bradyrhizobium]WGR71138.1 hypothetical protein MTX24_38525 [Bradyrhizobium sp. ISRA426]WGR75974.1 hypothetical protein MTX21_23630 [Bradyrhizobium sp. ISRA430]WGR86378.1 hypothetical protein MTX25_38215 [Bradyrhizobium sp. ISRA432]